jgi:hypothetical protein
MMRFFVPRTRLLLYLVFRDPIAFYFCMAWLYSYMTTKQLSTQRLPTHPVCQTKQKSQLSIVEVSIVEER